jgi:hypothetical protein
LAEQQFLFILTCRFLQGSFFKIKIIKMKHNLTKFYLPFLVLGLVFIQLNLTNIKTFSGSEIESLNYTCEIPHTYTDWNDVSCELPK